VGIALVDPGVHLAEQVRVLSGPHGKLGVFLDGVGDEIIQQALLTVCLRKKKGQREMAVLRWTGDNASIGKRLSSAPPPSGSSREPPYSGLLHYPPA